MLLRIAFTLLLLIPLDAFAQRGVFLSVDDFLAQHFSSPPTAKMLWLNPAQQQQAESVLHRRFGLRTRYYQTGQRTAWVLEEIGKELPITVGVVVEHNAIKHLQVLEFREVRGGEVRHQFFTDQFNGTALEANELALNRRIDGVTGATLSVRALKKIARLALYFHGQVAATKVAPPSEQAQSLCTDNIGDPSCGAGTDASASR